MPLPADLPVVDHHCHLSPSGEGVVAARRFRAAGGTHLFLTTQVYDGRVPGSVAEYEDQFSRTEALARRIHDEAGVVAYSVIAPYPVDLVTLVPRLGTAEAVQVQDASLDLAGRWVEDQRAVALGEVGRPHFPVSPEIASAAEEVFRHALETARDVGCPAVVHSEDLTDDGFRSLAAFAAGASFPVGRLIKHYTRRIVDVEARAGVVPSFLALRELVASALETPGPWFWETDFLDDPRRPGAVLDLATIPRRAEHVFQRNPSAVDRLRIPFQDSIRKVYGFTPERGDVALR